VKVAPVALFLAFHYPLQLNMLNAIEIYLNQIESDLQTDNATEHTHRPALSALLKAFLPDYRITNEPRRIQCGSPDFEIAKGEELIGHLEAKDVGIDLDKTEKSEQIQRYLPALNNLILTDYLEFRWFIEKDKQLEMTVVLGTWDAKKKKLSINKDQFSRFERLIKSFVETKILTLRTPEELAAKMAHIANEIKRSIELAYENEDNRGNIHSQLDSFRIVLIDTLTIQQFSDMVAQTICYGLFAAKCSAELNQPFSRIHAGFYLPKTNPFLRNLFNQMAGVDLDERLVWMVEHLVAVLNRADIGAILADFGKQTRQEDPVVHFYETFLAQYDPKLREVRGVYYTPEPVVSYIVRSVDLILKEKFDLKKGLADSSKINETTHKVQILDPATGTGTFLYSVIAKIFEQFHNNKGMWSDYVSKHLLPRLHGFELLMAAYTVAHMKLGLQLKEYGYDFKSNERLNIFLTNTLDEPHKNEETLLAKWLSNEANAASFVKAKSPVMVILGNPPYSGHSANTGEWISDLLHGVGNQANYFMVDGQSLNEKNPKWLNDDYVKFIRFAHWRIQQTGYGVLGFVTNHGYLDNPTFRGMRQSLMEDFDEIYILDLHGNSKKKEQSPDGSNDKNIFDIQQGVAVGIFIKHQKRKNKIATVYHAHLYGERKAKYQWLSANDLKTTDWTTLQPQSPFYLFVPQNIDLLSEYEKGWKITDIMPINSVGIVTARDNLTVQFDKEQVWNIVNDFSKLPPEKARDKYNLGEDARDWKVEFAQKDLEKLLKENIIKVLYKPFNVKYTYYTGNSRGFHCMPRPEVTTHLLKDNLTLLFTRSISKGKAFDHIFCCNFPILGRCFTDASCITYNAPLYLYPSEKDHFVNGNGSGNGHHKELSRKPNFSPEFITELESKLKLQFISENKGDFNQTLSALDVFHYMYAIFHSPTYRKRYAEFLKMDFPRLPVTNDKKLFEQLAILGEQLVNIHLMQTDLDYENNFPIEGNNIVEKVEYKNDKVYINKTQYFDNVKLDVWAFHIGGYQVCQKWLKDRKNHALNYEDCTHYLYILAAIEKTQQLMEKIDEVIGDFPIQ
jgi:predicted helicase